jgi:hypothetical protein
MKNFYTLLIIALVLVTGLLTMGCNKGPGRTTTMGIPANVNIDVSGRTMTITWSAVANAQGNEIITTSEGCSSGNRIINTKAGTAVVTSSGANASNVNIRSRNSIAITLMASGRDENTPMANVVTAKVKSLGGTVSGKQYGDSDYSAVVRHNIQKLSGGDIELSTPENVAVKVEGRSMTVTWNAVTNAQGYEIVTTSVACNSGNRTINTKEGTKVVTNTGTNARNVTIGPENEISITLMALNADHPNTPMASAVTAKIKSLGGTVAENVYVDSGYSEEINYPIQK